MANDHYNQRALIDFWSVGERRAWVYDFRDGSLKKRSTKRVFSLEGLNPPRVEAWVKQEIEDPLHEFRRAVSAYALDKRRPDPKEMLKREKTKLAVGLAFIVQGARGLDGVAGHADTLTFLMSEKADALAEYAAHYWNNNLIGSFFMPASKQVCLPDIGWYLFSTMDPARGRVWGQALPMGPRSVLYSLPAGVRFEADLPNTTSIERYSIGTTKACRELVIPGSWIEGSGVEGVTKLLPVLRKQVDIATLHAEKARSIVADMHVKSGLKPPVTLPG